MTNEDVLPFFDKLIVLRDSRENKTAGGIFIPESNTKLPDKGTVVAVGPDCEHVAVGDRVIFPRLAGTDLSGENRAEEKVLLRERDLVGKLIEAE